MMHLICQLFEKILGFGRLLEARREKGNEVIADGILS